MSCKVFKGNFIFAVTIDCLKTFNGYLVVRDGIIIAHCSELLDDKYQNILVTDFGNHLVIPSFVDLHNHIADYAIKGLGLDTDLATWYDSYGQKVNERFNDIKYAKKHYAKFIHWLWKNGITHSVLYNVCDLKSNELFLEIMSKTKLNAYIGKLNFDQNVASCQLRTRQQLVKDNEFLIGKKQWNEKIKPIITIDNAWNCTKALMQHLSALSTKFNLPMQAHFAETKDDAKWISTNYENQKNYLAIYEEVGMLKNKVVLAHCNYTNKKTRTKIRKYQAFIAHCPLASVNYWCGVANIRTLLDENINVGLGTDGAGSTNRAMLDIIVNTIFVSKMNALKENNLKNIISSTTSFYLATKGGGAFFGKTGSFEVGYEFNALVIDDHQLCALDPSDLALSQRFERFLYYGTSDDIQLRFVLGQEIVVNDESVPS